MIRAKLKIKSWDDAEKQARDLLDQLEVEAEKSPMAKRLKTQVIRLLKLVKKSRVYSELGEENEWKEWKAKNEFKPWI